MKFKTYFLFTEVLAKNYISQDYNCIEVKTDCNFHEHIACFGPLEEKGTQPGSNTQTLCVPDSNC